MKKFGRIWVFFMILLFTLVMVEGPGDLLAQGGKYPSKPLNLICGSAAGAPIDIMARELAKLAEKDFGQRINVVNKTGGSGMVAVGYVLSQPPDGYTIATEGTGITSILLMPNAPYKLSNVRFVIRIQTDPFTLFINAESPWKNLKEFLEAGKKEKLNIGGYATASAQHFFMLELARMAGIEVKWLAYNSGKDALIATMGKNLDGTLSNYSVITQGGDRIRTIGVSTGQRVEDGRNVPTFKEQGYNLVKTHWRGLYVKNGTPREYVVRLHDIFKKAMQTAEWKEYMKNSQMQDGYLSTADFQKAVDDQTASDLRMLKELGLVK
jgi:putative tricarboxylic transport membrane protein